MNASILRRFSSFFVLLCMAMLLRVDLSQAAEPLPAIIAITGSNDSNQDEDKSDSDQNLLSSPDEWQERLERHRSHHRSHYGRDVVNIGRDSYLGPDDKADSVVAVFGTATSEGQADDVVSVIGKTRVTGPTSDNVVGVLSSVYVDSKVDGDVVAVFGGVTLGPHAEVGGDVVTVFGSQNFDPHAIVHGGTEHVMNGDFGDTGWLQTWIKECVFKGRLLAMAPGLGWVWSLAIVALVFYALLAVVFRPGVTRCVQTLESEPGHTFLAALVASLLTPVLLVLLLVTVIGIAAIPFVIMALICMSLFGKAVMLAWLGSRVLGARQAASPVHPAVAVLVGGVIAMALYMIPVLGFLIFKLLGFFGFGAVVYTLVLAQRARQAARADRYHAPTPPPPRAPATAAASAAGFAAASAAAATSATEAQPATPAASDVASPSALTAMPRAGFWLRIGALLIDVILIGIVMSVSDSLLWGWHRGGGELHLFVLAIYGACMWKLRGSTVGGLVCDLRVVRLDGRPVEWETSIVRALACFLSLAVCGLGFIWIAFDPERQAWHDKIAGTVVVRVPKGTP
jgi:uncharacterized RDD family membrane protein YckC